MSDESKITQTAKAIEGIVKAVPIYQDAIQPAAKQIGIALETLTKTIHVALAPVSVLVWGYEKISDFLSVKLTEKLKNVPPERIITPNLLVAGPILESLRFAAHEKTLRELYANLLATSIDSETAKNAHPGFVAILQSMSPDEAKILKLFTVDQACPLIDVKAVKQEAFLILKRNFSFIGKHAGCKYQELVPNYLDNLVRLGLLELIPNRYILGEGIYEPLQESKELDLIKQKIEDIQDATLGFDKKKIELTDLGKQFCSACVIDKSLQL